MNRCTKAIGEWADEQMRAQQTENEQALYDQLMQPASYGSVIGGREDSDAAEPANLHEYPGDDAVASAERFARGCLVQLEAAQRVPAPTAFRSLQAALRADPDYAWAWHCNVAMPVMDATGVSHEMANATAAKLMRHLFDIDTTTHPHYRAMFESTPQGVKPAPLGVLAIAEGRTGLRIGEA
jgi:hypothetical protein